MTKIISVEEIGLCRSGPNNDIDLQAVFGGIKGRQQKGLKVNPVYDSNHGNALNSSQDINGNINNVRVVTYTSIPDPHTSTTSDNSKPPCNQITGPTNENHQRNPGHDHKDSNGNHKNSIKTVAQSGNDNMKKPASNKAESSNSGSPTGNMKNNLNIYDGNQDDLLVDKLQDVPVCQIKENTEGSKSKQMKEDINKNGIVLGVNGIMGKNGSVKREGVVIESQSIKTKPLAVPVHLSKIDKSENENIDNLVENKNIRNKMLEKRGSGYQLLGYNNEGYVADETSIHLQTIDDDANSRDKANSENVESSVVETVSSLELHKRDNQANPNEFEKESKINDDKSVSKSDYVDACNKEKEKSKAASSIESVQSSNNIVRTISSFSSTSEQSVKTEIITEVHVHREDSNQNQTNLNNANKDLFNDSSKNSDTDMGNSQTCDSPPNDVLNSEMQEVTDHLSLIDNLDSFEVVSETPHNNIIQVTDREITCIQVTDREITGTQVTDKDSNVTQVDKQGDEIIDTDKEVETVQDKTVDDPESSKMVTFLTAEIQGESVSNGYKTNASSTRTLKSILLTSNGKQPTPPDFPNNEQSHVTEIESEIHEIKTVKFSEDTVFNENKSKRYKLDKMEKINLREIYRGKISCDSAVAKMNPIFHDDMESQDIEKSMSEDEKIAYQIALKKMMKSTGKGKDPTSPAYRDHYLILQANGIRSSNSAADNIQTDLEQPAYDRLIQRTIAKERRKLIVKWILVILVVAIVTTIATVLGVHFK